VTAPLALLVFACAATLDFAVVRYQQAVTDRRAHRAGRWSVLIYLLGAVGFLSVVDGSRWYVLPECLGLYAGNLLALRGKSA
jgi:hypothetical protein